MVVDGKQKLIGVLQQQPDNSLVIFVEKMTKFDKLFCDMMADGVEFTLRLEVRGKAGRLEQTRVFLDDVGRPSTG